MKAEPEDFIVEEIPVDLPASENGKYTILKMRLRNWDTNMFLVYLARYLRISRKRITYCGTKDKRGVTTQYFCLNHKFDPMELNLRNAEVMDSFSTDRMLRLGDLRGNRFEVDLKTERNHLSAIRKTADQVYERGGFPNFFGLQRFGSIRTNTHRIGKLLVLGEYEKAAMTYLYDPEFDDEDYRINFSRNNDPRVALGEYPERLSFERSLLGYMDEHGSLEGAFSALPRNLSMMFVHAYQSYIYNRVLSSRLKEDGTLTLVHVGDVMLKVDELFNPDKSEEIRVNRLNLTRMSEMAAGDKLRPTIPLVGYETNLTAGFGGEIEEKILADEKVTPEMFRIQGYPDLSSKGERRVISCKPIDFTIRDSGVLSFSLGRGIYATSLLREFTKKAC